MVELVYIFDEKSTLRVFKKVSRLLKCHSNFLGVPYIYTHTYKTDYITLARKCGCRVNSYMKSFLCFSIYLLHTLSIFILLS